MLTQNRLIQLLDEFPTRRIAVVGDFFLDKYQEVDSALQETSLETGLAAHQIVRKWHSPGAAGTVVNNLRGLAAGGIFAIGLTGDDGEGFELRRALEARHCDISGLVVTSDRFTPVYLKTMVKGETGLNAERERFDTKNRSPLPADIENELISRIDARWPDVHAIILADQAEETDCGVLTRRVREHLIQRTHRDPGKVVWVDSRCRIGLYSNMITKPNEKECMRAVLGASTSPPPAGGRGNTEADRCATVLSERLGRPVFMTRGKRGILIVEPDRLTPVPGVSVPEPTDPTGAGDSATAGAVMAMTSGASLVEAAVVANLVASITVQQLGTTGFATPDQLPPRLDQWHRQQTG